MRRRWENVQHPQWDNDDWYVNYLGHPLGAANCVLERSLGVRTDIRVQFFLPGLAPHAQFADHTASSRNRRQEHHYRSPGVGIEFVSDGRRRSARRAQYE
jgi:hypothetical protein